MVTVLLLKSYPKLVLPKNLWSNKFSHIPKSCIHSFLFDSIPVTVMMGLVTPQNDAGCSAKDTKTYQAESRLLIHSSIDVSVLVIPVV